MRTFFEWSEYLDEDVTKQLRHIKQDWELMWDDENKQYIEEEYSFAEDLNKLFKELENIVPPKNYHEFEDNIAKYQIEFGKSRAKKKGKKWDVVDYASFIEQGAFHDINEYNLKKSAAGRIRGAITRKQNHYDEMEISHRIMLGDILAIILYHSENNK